MTEEAIQEHLDKEVLQQRNETLRINRSKLHSLVEEVMTKLGQDRKNGHEPR
jgi:hypothetical protein